MGCCEVFFCLFHQINYLIIKKIDVLCCQFPNLACRFGTFCNMAVFMADPGFHALPPTFGERGMGLVCFIVWPVAVMIKDYE